MRLQLGPSEGFARHETDTHSCMAYRVLAVTMWTAVSRLSQVAVHPLQEQDLEIGIYIMRTVMRAASAQRRTYCVANARCMAPRGVAVEAEGLRLVHRCPVLHAPAQRSKHRPGVLAEGLHHLAAVPSPKTLLKRLRVMVSSSVDSCSIWHFTW